MQHRWCTTSVCPSSFLSLFKVFIIFKSIAAVQKVFPSCFSSYLSQIINLMYVCLTSLVVILVHWANWPEQKLNDFTLNSFSSSCLYFKTKKYELIFVLKLFSLYGTILDFDAKWLNYQLIDDCSTPIFGIWTTVRRNWLLQFTEISTPTPCLDQYNY